MAPRQDSHFGHQLVRINVRATHNRILPSQALNPSVRQFLIWERARPVDRWLVLLNLVEAPGNCVQGH